MKVEKKVTDRDHVELAEGFVPVEFVPEESADRIGPGEISASFRPAGSS